MFDIKVIQKLDCIQCHDIQGIIFFVVKFAALTMAAIVKRHYPVSSTRKCLYPARIYPVHLSGRSKAVNKKNGKPLSFIKIGNFSFVKRCNRHTISFDSFAGSFSNKTLATSPQSFRKWVKGIQDNPAHATGSRFSWSTVWPKVQ